MRIALNGETGFVGRNIARALTDAGHKTALLAMGMIRLIRQSAPGPFHRRDLRCRHRRTHIRHNVFFEMP